MKIYHLPAIFKGEDHPRKMYFSFKSKHLETIVTKNLQKCYAQLFNNKLKQNYLMAKTPLTRNIARFGTKSCEQIQNVVHCTCKLHFGYLEVL